MTDTELEDLLRRFAERTLPKPEWTHAAHLAVGLWHVCRYGRYGRDDALSRLRADITRLNESHGTVNSATSGYHMDRARPRAARVEAAPGSTFRARV